MDKKDKKSRKAKKGDLDDFDMEKELADLEAPQEPVQAKKPPKKTDDSGDQANVDEKQDENLPEESKQKGKKGKKGKKQLEDDFDMEKELAEVEPAQKQPEVTKPAAKGKKPSGKETVAEEEKPMPPPAAPLEKDKKKKAGKEAAEPKAKAEPEPLKAPEKVAEEKPSTDGEKKKPANKAKEQMKEQLRRIQEEKDRFQRQEEERIRKEEEEEQKRIDDIQKEKERKEREKQKKKERTARLKSEGKFLTAKQKQDQQRAQAMIESLKAQGITVGQATKKAHPPRRTEKQTSEESAEKQPEVEPEIEESEEEEEEEMGDWDQIADKELVENQEPELLVQPPEVPVSSTEDLSPTLDLPTATLTSSQRLGHLRSAVVCVLGHVDTGKTKILDKIRRTNVQDMEAGGITQQIGATMIPDYALTTQCSMVRGFAEKELRLPGLLIIDTPGHESFSNLRSRGSSLCDIAILVVDIMHGLEPQTIESLNMLKSRKTPFIVALNKIDRLFGWKTLPKLDFRDAMAQQTQNVQMEFKKRCQETVVQFAEQGLNAAVFFENPDPKTFISMVPTSAHSGDGMGNLMGLIVEICQTMLSKRLTFSNDLQCTVLEVKELTGLGTTVDVILTNGSLSEGDTIVLAGFEGPVITQVRGLLMPQPLKELRVKNPYEKHKIIHGAQGVKILAKDLETALAGLPLYVANTPEDQEKYRKEIEFQLESVLKSIQRSDKGVYVQASTLGSLEALVEFLRTSKIPYCGINIGPVHKKDVRTASAMLEQEPEYAVILAFDVKVEREAQLLADELGVRIFAADIIYHLFDRFTQYKDDLKAKKREENKHLAIFPCKLKILPQFVFNSRDPIVCGVVVEAGILKIGTPLCVPSKEFVDIGIVTSIEVNHKAMDIAKKGQEICIKIEPEPGSTPKLLGRHFELDDVIVSKISRPSIDVCKEYFRDDLTKADWQLMVELKKLLDIF